MNEQIKRTVISLLERYPDTVRKISVLRYELEHPAPDEMIDVPSDSP